MKWIQRFAASSLAFLIFLGQAGASGVNFNVTDNLSAPLNNPAFTGNISFPGTGIWNSAGDVGIGTIVPSSGLRLDVEGKVGATEYCNETGLTCYTIGDLVENGTTAVWGSITGTLADQTDLQNALGLKANTADLATVATSGDYADLTNAPAIDDLLPTQTGNSGKYLTTDGSNASWGDVSTGVVDHGALTGLTDDDHTQYALLAGRSGGQSLTGGTGVTDKLVLQGTSANGTSTAAALQVNVGNNGGTNALTVLNDGKVGVGTSSPDSLLHIYSSGSRPEIHIQETTANSAAQIYLQNPVRTWDLGADSDPDIFYIGNSGDDTQNTFVLTADKKMGLGITSPQDTFHISNTADVGILLEADSDNISEGDNPQITLTQDGGGTDGFIALEGNAGTQSTDTIANAFLLGTEDSYSPIQFITNDIVRATINSSGNVGIGTTSPTEKLDVNGNINFTGELNINSVPGTSGQVLTSGGDGSAPTWETLPTGTDDQTLDLTGNTLSIEDGNSVDLSSYLDNTDSQDLDLSGNTLSLTGDGTTVDLSSYLDNTDDQTLSEILGTSTDAGGNAITNLASPSSGSDAATKTYVDNLINGLTWKAPVDDADGPDGGTPDDDLGGLLCNSTNESFATYNKGDSLIYVCNGTNWVEMSSTVGLPDLNGDITGSITSNVIADDIIDEANLKVTNSANDNYLLTFDNATGGFTWIDPTTVGSTSFIALSDTPNSFTAGSVLFTSNSAVAEDNSNFFWDDTEDRLGIGTASPNAKLHIKTDTGTNSEIDIQSGAENHWGIYQDETTADLRFWNTDDRLTITDDGNIGIGTTSPTYALAFGNTQDQEIGVESQVADLAGNALSLLAGNAGTGLATDFVSLGQTTRLWYGITADSSGNVYATTDAGDIYKQTGGTGDFLPLGQASRNWRNMTADSSGNIYAAVSNGDIYKQTGGTGDFLPLGQTSRLWRNMTADSNGNIYAAVWNGDIYKQTGGTGDFLPLGQTSRLWTDMTNDSSGNVYATVSNGDIYKQTGGTGNFLPLGQTTRNWTGITTDSSGNVYAAVSSGDIYKQTGGTGDFLPLGQTSRYWTGMTADSSGNIYAAEYGGDIYELSSSGGTPNLSGGELVLTSGAGKGTGASTISFKTGTTLSSGNTLQPLQTKMTILGNGNVGIGTTSPTEKLDVNGNINFTGELNINSVPGTSGQVLTSGGDGSAPTWETLPTGTDDQTLDLTGNTLSIEDGNSVDLSSYLDNTDDQTLSEILGTSTDAGGNAITNLASPSSGSDAATKTYVDNLINGLTWKAPVDDADGPDGGTPDDDLGGLLCNSTNESFATYNKGDSLIYVCNGTNWVEMSSTVGLPDLNGDITGSITSNVIADDIIDEANLKVTNSANDNYLLTFDNATGGFTWIDPTTVGSTSFIALSDTPNSFTAGSVLFTSNSAVAEDNSNFFWDDTEDRLGIGTASPNAKLHIKTDTGTNSEIDIQSGAENHWGIYQDETTADLRFWNTDDRLTITDDGNIGIGTTSPDSGTGGQLKLDTEGNIGATKYCDENGDNCYTTSELSDTLSQLSCADGQTAKWNDTNAAWECADGSALSHQFTTTETWNAPFSGSTITPILVDATNLTTGRLRVMVDGVLKAIVPHGAKEYRVLQPSSNLSVVAEDYAYDVSTASYDSSFDISSQSQGASDIAFNTDGTKMFVLDNNNTSIIFEYHLSTGFDVSTASYDSSFDISAQSQNATNIAFNTDGTKMFVLGNDNNIGIIAEYHLSTGFDVSTASYDSNFDPYSNVNFFALGFIGLAFNTDGTKMFVMALANPYTLQGSIVEYHLSTGFDVSTASYDSIGAPLNLYDYYANIVFSPDGGKLFLSSGFIGVYNLSTGFDVSTLSQASDSITGEQPMGPFAFNADGTKMLVLDVPGSAVSEYNLDGAFFGTAYASVGPGGSTSAEGTDNLGNHTATQNIKLNENWLSNDGDNEGIAITNGGNVGIGTTSPTAVLHLKAGTATASTAPLKFTSGTLLTTPEAGAVEYFSNQFYLRGSDGLSVAGNVGIGTATPTYALAFGNTQDQEIGVESQVADLAGNALSLLAGNAGIGSAASTNFVSLGQTSRTWWGITADSSGNVYATTDGGDIYKQTGGTGDFLPLGQTSRHWTGMTADSSGNIYAAEYGGDIYKQTGGTGDFLPLGQTSRNWYGITADSSGNVYATIEYGDIYKQTGGTGDFLPLGQTSRSWDGITADSSGNIYATEILGDIYKQTGGTGDFLPLGQTSRNWYSMTADSSGNIYAAVNSDNIYEFFATSGGAPNLSGGELVLSSGAGKGTGASTISFKTGTTISSGSTLQSLQTKMTILGNGNVGIGTISPIEKLDVSGNINVSTGNNYLINGSQISSVNLSNDTNLTKNDDTDISGNSWVLDEDDFASDSATKVPTQQSIREYVDDIDFRFSRTNVAYNASDAAKDAVCVSDFGSNYQAARILDVMLQDIALIDTSTFDKIAFNVYGDSTQSFAPYSIFLGLGVLGGDYPIGCIVKSNDFRFSRTNVAYNASDAAKDAVCVGDFGSNYQAARILDLSLQNPAVLYDLNTDIEVPVFFNVYGNSSESISILPYAYHGGYFFDDENKGTYPLACILK
ncbi:hypothetical protein IPN35_03250 [Candidatus Peregrinibacteria bacterium]|nr:MAG: hypothetical protein IPN35_03250 [Candidatus Peregrinibacteria bacterium]